MAKYFSHWLSPAQQKMMATAGYFSYKVLSKFERKSFSFSVSDLSSADCDLSEQQLL